MGAKALNLKTGPLFHLGVALVRSRRAPPA